MTKREELDKIKGETAADVVVLFREGDFYIAYAEDARAIGPKLGLTITTQYAKKAGRSIATGLPMVGFPYHQLESYLRKLIAIGVRVAIADAAGNVDAKFPDGTGIDYKTTKGTG